MTMPLSPAQVDDKLRQLVNEITASQKELAACRDLETETDLVYKKAKLTASHSVDCPVVARGAATVGQRDDWIDERCFTEYGAVRRAVSAREIAQDHLRAVLAIAEVVRSLGASVRTSYEMAGSH